MTEPNKPQKTESPNQGAAAYKDGAKPGPKEADVQVRPAGPDAQANKPKEWDQVDEAVDESFPASDPPGTY